MEDFKGKVVVITGAAKGIGFSTAKKFYLNGAIVVILDLKFEEKNLKLNENERVYYMECDVSNIESVEKTFINIREKLGRIDVLVNNAGVTQDAMFHKMTYEEFDKAIKVSLYGTFNCTKQVVDGMRERGYGRIINISSMAARGNIGQANYSAAKAGIIGLTKTLSLELASKGITVNAIAPGMVNTDIIKSVPDKVKKLMMSQIPMKRFGEAEEVSDLIYFLAGDSASYISGQCIKISGAWF
ncbi:3-oxoacyl-ACP reductase FabG [Peptoniphilaceae bacterium SGI.131]